MTNIKFEMMRYGESGAVWKDLEKDFEGLRYMRCEGLNDYGEVTSNHTETYPESSKADSYVSKTPAHKPTTIKLTLYFFEGGEDDEKNDATYHSFMKFITGSKVVYRDTKRKRKALMELEGEPTKPKADTLYGQKYKEVTFTFKNVYGMTFGYDDIFPSREVELLQEDGNPIMLVE